MLDFAFMHRRRHQNVGDLACSPGHYFDFGPKTFLDFSEDMPACKVAVLGGGQVFQDCVTAAVYDTAKAHKRVVWGVGISQKDRRSIDFDLLSGSCDLVSTRNWGIDGCPYVPCASAMSPLFDTPPAPEHEVVLFYHARKSDDLPRDPTIPSRGNDQGTMAEAIAFLASGATVVTNSYHGTYWAMCLGRRVLCLPFSNKFLNFPDNPPLSAPEDWRAKINTAEARPEMLATARTRNRAFFDQVMNLI